MLGIASTCNEKEIVLTTVKASAGLVGAKTVHVATQSTVTANKDMSSRDSSSAMSLQI